MICHVYRQARKAIDRVVVATDDHRIAHIVQKFGGQYVMTDPDLPDGTHRCLAAALQISDCPDLIVNIQGDEPFIDPADIRQTISCMANPDVSIATLACRLSPTSSPDVLLNPDRVKVVIDNDGNALYFSRSPIPFVRGYNPEQWPRHTQYFIHSGLYVYRKSALLQLDDLPPSPLADAESLEQLRWLQNGYRIKVAITNNFPLGIDTPADILHAEKILKK